MMQLMADYPALISSMSRLIVMDCWILLEGNSPRYKTHITLVHYLVICCQLCFILMIPDGLSFMLSPVDCLVSSRLLINSYATPKIRREKTLVCIRTMYSFPISALFLYLADFKFHLLLLSFLSTYVVSVYLLFLFGCSGSWVRLTRIYWLYSS